MAKTFKQVLAEAGVSMDFQVWGTAPDEIVDREIKRDPHPRVLKLRAIYFESLSSANNEFSYWYSREYFAERNHCEPAVIRRARALKCAFSHLTPLIIPGELLAVHKTHYQRGSFPMPWLSQSYYMEQEDALFYDAIKCGSACSGEHPRLGDGGGNVTKSFDHVVSISGKFGMRMEEIPALLKLARLWVGKSVEDLGHHYEMMVPNYATKEKIMRSLVCMFDSGYTLPQGREVINYYYPLQYGLDKIIKICQEREEQVAGCVDGDGLVGANRLYNYEAMKLATEGVQAWFLNYAKEARRLERIEKDSVQKREYGEIAETMEWIAHNPPRTYREAHQLINACHLAVLNEDAISGLSPGRIGQVLYPYFEQDLAAGRLTEDEVLEYMELDRIYKTSIDAFASMGVTGGVLSGNTFNTVSIGGLNREGMSAANQLEYIIMEAGIRAQMPQSSLAVLYHESLPESFLMKAVECIKTGAGFPAFINCNVAHEFLLNQYAPEGMDNVDVRAWAIGGCLGAYPCGWKPLTLNGKTYWIPGGMGQPASVGVHFISLPKLLELVLFNGLDQRTREQVFAPHNRTFTSYEDIWEQFKKYWQEAVDVLVRCNNLQHDIWRKNNMCVWHSMLKPDCLDKGHLVNELGYRYNGTYNCESAGTVNYVNSMVALKKIVFDDKIVTLDEVKQALAENFGFKSAHEINNYSLADQEKKADDQGKWDELHFALLTAPKYGNAEPYADAVLAEWENFYCPDCYNYESLYGRPLYACQLSVSTHGAMGAAAIASADGRLAGTTFADASLSAYPGTDRNGPHALMASACCWNHAMSQATQLNIKIHPSALKGDAGSRKLLELTRDYMRKGGFHVQYNVVDTKMLKDAQLNPQNYRDLMVEVAGFTQYWVEIGKYVQDEIIARTEYEGV